MATEKAPEFNWDSITAQSTTRMRAPKIVPVPASVARLAQESYDGRHNADTGEVEHILYYEFPDAEVAARFAGFMKRAGDHTTPLTSVSVLVDPEREKDGPEVNPRLVKWRAGQRRGKAAASTV